MNDIGVTFAHESENFSINRQVHVDTKVDFSLACCNLVKHNLELQVNQQRGTKKGGGQTAVAAKATATLGTSPTKTSGNSLPMDAGLV